MRRLHVRGDDAGTQAAGAGLAGDDLVFRHAVQQQPSPFYEEAQTALGAQEEERAEQLLGVEEDLLSAFRALRDEVLGERARSARRSARCGSTRISMPRGQWPVTWSC